MSIFDKDIECVMFEADTIKKRVKEIANKINQDYFGKEVTMICVLKGAMVFFADLIREIDLELSLECVKLSSYGNKTQSDKVSLEKFFSCDIIENKHIIVVDDISDTGKSLNCLKGDLEKLNAASIKFCALFDKPARREVEFVPDYIGFEVENQFIVGYGLDFAQKYRNLPYVAVLKEDVYTN